MLLHLTRALQLAAAVAAVTLARRRVDHRPFAAFLCLVTVANLVRAAIGPALAPRPEPFTGVLRALGHLEEALFLTWAAGLATLAVWLLVLRRWLAIGPVLAWIGLVAYLATHYPEIRGEALRKVYLGAELAALFVAVVAIASFVARRERMTPARLCLGLCVGADIACLFAGAWRWGLWEHYELTQASLCVLYAVLTLYQGVSCYSHSRPASP